MTEAALPEVHYSVRFLDGPDGDWLVLSYTCSEQLNGGCNMILDLASEDTCIELSELLGATCELGLGREGGALQHVYGIVQGVDLIGRVEHHLVFRVHVTSAFELGRLQQDSRIWQDVSPLAVIEEVLDRLLGAYGRTYDVGAISRAAEPRTYCVQYNETDHGFVCRLLEETGISYYFVHDPDVGHEVLTLCDANEHYTAVDNLDGNTSFPLVSHSPEQAAFESLQKLEWSQRLTPTAVLRRDYDWHEPRHLLSSTVDASDRRGLTRRAYRHLERRFERDDLGERAQDHAHALALSGSVARARSNALPLRPGARFTTDAHSESGAPEEFIVTSVHHRGADPRASSFALVSAEATYANEFDCVAADRTIRPLALTPKPDMRGAQTATVVGDDEIHTDEHGRIQIQFHWEESPSYASGASCWVRCAQSWAGSGWGAQFVPRVGMEVVVEFLEGNPDRPLVVGCVYNGDNSPPFVLPGSSTQSGWRTNSSPGGSGSNELRFEDASGSEEIYIHGQKDWRVEVNNDTSRSTGHDETHSIGRNLRKSVQNDQAESVGANKSISVGSDHSESIGASMTLTVGTDQTITIGNNQTITVAKNRSETIDASAAQIVAVANTTTVGGANTIIVGGTMNTSVGGVLGEEIAGAKSVSVGGMSSENVVGDRSVSAANISQSARSKIDQRAGTEFALTADKKISLTSDGDMGTRVKKNLVIDAGDEFTVKCGSTTFSMKKNGQILIKGKKVTVKGSDKIIIKGAKVTEN